MWSLHPIVTFDLSDQTRPLFSGNVIETTGVSRFLVWLYKCDHFSSLCPPPYSIAVYHAGVVDFINIGWTKFMFLWPPLSPSFLWAPWLFVFWRFIVPCHMPEWGGTQEQEELIQNTQGFFSFFSSFNQTWSEQIVAAIGCLLLFTSIPGKSKLFDTGVFCSRLNMSKYFQILLFNLVSQSFINIVFCHMNTLT